MTEHEAARTAHDRLLNGTPAGHYLTRTTSAALLIVATDSGTRNVRQIDDAIDRLKRKESRNA